MHKNVGTLGKLTIFCKRMLCKYPILVQATQTAILMGTADVLAQKAVEQKCNWDVLRTAQFASLGLVGVGPVLTLWYRTLARLVHGSGPSVALKKMALDQFLFAPVFIAAFLAALYLIQGKCWEEMKQELKNKYPDILITNYKIFPAVQMVNFNFVPLNYQVLLAQSVSLFWNTYLSWKSQLAIGDEDAAIKPKVTQTSTGVPRPKLVSKKADDDCK